jgi:hypothetical protein
MNFFNNKKFPLTQYLALGLLRKWGKALGGQSQIDHTLIGMMMFFQDRQVWATRHRTTTLSSNFRQKLRLHDAQIPFASTVIIPKGLPIDSNRKLIPHFLISLYQRPSIIYGPDPSGHGISLSLA